MTYERFESVLYVLTGLYFLIVFIASYGEGKFKMKNDTHQILRDMDIEERIRKFKYHDRL